MCEERHKRPLIISHLGAQTDTLTNCGTVQVFTQHGKEFADSSKSLMHVLNQKDKRRLDVQRIIQERGHRDQE